MESVAELTDEQAIIALAAPDARLVVDAPPGTGKTYTLIARAIALSELDPPVDTVALTFSRNVVAEVSTRLAEAGAGHVSAWTIDGFAHRLRRLAGEEVEFRGYDEGIRDATKVLVEGRLPMLNLRHVLVDEIQDLRGPRREFVIELIRVADCGFTAFGDPGQAIYDFQEDDSDKDVFAALSDEFDAETLRLSKNFRNQEVVVPRADDQQELEDYYEALTPLADVTDIRPWARSGHPVAVLTRTNGQALRLALDLEDAEISADLNQRATYSPVPSWLLEVLERSTGSVVGKDQFFEIVAGIAGAPDPDVAWRTTRTFIAHEKALSARTLRRAISSGARFPSRPPHAHCVVSTIHRAKGLEWEIVVVADDGCEHPDAEADLEDRLRYVALTRAQDATYRLPLTYRYMKKDRSGRWLLPYPRTGWRAIELIPGDVDDSVPFPGTADVDLTSTVQGYLRDSVVPGDEVSLRREGTDTSLLIEHHGNPIGRTSEQFIDAYTEKQVKKMMELKRVKILGVRVAAGGPDLTEDCGLSDLGLWLVPEIAGLGYVKWRKKDD